MIYILIILISFTSSAVLMPILRKIGIKRGFCDQPDGNKLKIHKNPIPYLGGLGIFFGLIAGLIFSRLFHQISGLQAVGVILGSIIILFLGFWDDLKWKKSSRPLIKLFYQFLAGALIVFILIKIGVDFKFSLNPIIGAFIAGFYIVGAMNAMNMEDGMDGLAGGLTAISLIGFIILSIAYQTIFPLAISLALLGAVLGFLIYNFEPASIFMGDNGSHFLGFSLALLAIIFTGHPIYNFSHFAGPILIIGLPVFDAGWAIIRRLGKGKSPFLGDRGHLYDKINQKGLSSKKTVLLCWLIQCILVIIGIGIM